jgi:hypothetical protein
MRRRNLRGGSRRFSRSASGEPVDANLAAILSILGAQSNGVFFDTAWDDGVDLVDDGGTERCVAVESRPISGQTQYTIGPQISIPLGLATALSPTGKRLLVGAGTQYIIGAAALAGLFVGTAAYTAVSVASRTNSATMVEWSFALSSVTDNRINHYVSAAGNVDGRQRTQAGAGTLNTGGAMANATLYVRSTTFSGAAYSSWMTGVASIVAQANTRAPAALDELILGAQRSGGTLASFWVGQLGPLALCSGVLSAPDRVALENAMRAYYGVP